MNHLLLIGSNSRLGVFCGDHAWVGGSERKVRVEAYQALLLLLPSHHGLSSAAASPTRFHSEEGTQVTRWWIKSHHPPSSLFFQLSSFILLTIFWLVLIYLLYRSNIVESLTSIQNNIPLHRTIASHHRLSPPLLPSQICVCACIMQSPGPVPKPRAGGDAGHTILQAFLFFFSLTSFITFILTAIAAANYNKTLSTYIKNPENRVHETTRRPI